MMYVGNGFLSVKRKTQRYENVRMGEKAYILYALFVAINALTRALKAHSITV